MMSGLLGLGCLLLSNCGWNGEGEASSLCHPLCFVPRHMVTCAQPLLRDAQFISPFSYLHVPPIPTFN